MTSVLSVLEWSQRLLATSAHGGGSSKDAANARSAARICSTVALRLLRENMRCDLGAAAAAAAVKAAAAAEESPEGGEAEDDGAPKLPAWHPETDIECVRGALPRAARLQPR
jgi:hypothetical protein